MSYVPYEMTKLSNCGYCALDLGNSDFVVIVALDKMRECQEIRHYISSSPWQDSDLILQQRRRTLQECGQNTIVLASRKPPGQRCLGCGLISEKEDVHCDC